MSDVLIEADSRGRVALGRLVERDARYIATRADDGTITLTPAVVMTAHQAALLARPDVVASIRANRADPSRRVRR